MLTSATAKADGEMGLTLFAEGGKEQFHHAANVSVKWRHKRVLFDVIGHAKIATIPRPKARVSVRIAQETAIKHHIHTARDTTFVGK